jgi:hypothetical protein
MLVVLEGEPVRVISVGDAFWEPDGDVIHYQDGNPPRRHQGPIHRQDDVILGKPSSPSSTPRSWPIVRIAAHPGDPEHRPAGGHPGRPAAR